MSRVMRTAPAVVYPSADDRPMAESDAQLGAMLYRLTALRIHYRRASGRIRGRRPVHVLRGGQPRGSRGAGCHGRDRGAEASGGSAPEPTSCGRSRRVRTSYWRSRRAARGRWTATKKRAVYASLGVEEYWLYDPTGERFTTRLRGMRLVEGRYRELAARAPGSASVRRAGSPGVRTVRSTVLGLDLCVERGGALSLHDPVRGRALPGYEEEHVAREAAEARVAELEALVRGLRDGRSRRREAGEGPHGAGRDNHMPCRPATRRARAVPRP